MIGISDEEYDIAIIRAHFVMCRKGDLYEKKTVVRFAEHASPVYRNRYPSGVGTGGECSGCETGTG